MLPSLYLYVYHILWYLKCTGKVTYISRRDWILCNLFPWINSNKKRKKKVPVCQNCPLALRKMTWVWCSVSGFRGGMAEGLGRPPFGLESATLKTKLKVGLVSEVRTLSLGLTFLRHISWDLAWWTQDFDLSSFTTVKPVL